MLELPMDARLLINDGLHRRAAVGEAMMERPEFCDDHVPVIFFVHRRLKRSQQMFADLNKHGRIGKAKTNMRLTANLPKTQTGLGLTPDEHALEQNLAANHG